MALCLEPQEITYKQLRATAGRFCRKRYPNEFTQCRDMLVDAMLFGMAAWLATNKRRNPGKLVTEFYDHTTEKGITFDTWLDR